MALLLDQEGRIVQASSRFLDAMGHDRDQVLGHGLEEFLSEDSRSDLTDRLPAELGRTGACIDQPYRLIRNDGEALDVLLSATSEGDQPTGATRYLAILQDVTQALRRKKVQYVLSSISELPSRETSLRDLLSYIQSEIGQLMDSRNFYVALSHDKETGTFSLPFIADENADELISPNLLLDLSGGFSDRVMQTEQPFLINRSTAKAMAARGEIELLGTEAASWLGVPLRSTDGLVFGVVAVQSYQDPAAYGESDQEVLSIISSTIASAVSATRAEAERRALIEKLSRSEKMEALGRLAGGVAHDLNNVLNAIVSYPELLMEDLPPESPLLEPLEVIRDSGEKAAAIVEDLLTLARRGVPTREVVALNEVVRTYLGSPECRKLLVHHSGVTIETELDENLTNMQGSVVHLTKTVMNLVSNAAEAMPRGGVITISTANRSAENTALAIGPTELDRDYVALRVADCGVGIARDEIEKVFEPFYTKKVMGRSGTGLGMAVVWGTVEDHRGSIHVESNEGVGTVFELLFPASERTIATLPSQLPLADYLGAGEKLLVVDDREDQRAIASRILRRFRYEVDSVASGEQAIDYVRSQRVDLVVLDMIMDPGIDGLETFRRLREIQPELPAIIVSGYSESIRVRQAQELGAGQYLSKPYTIKKLGAAVKTALDGRSSEQSRATLSRESKPNRKGS